MLVPSLVAIALVSWILYSHRLQICNKYTKHLLRDHFRHRVILIDGRINRRTFCRFRHDYRKMLQRQQQRQKPRQGQPNNLLLILHTPGGDVKYMCKILALIDDYRRCQLGDDGSVTCLVPCYAHSCGTVIAMMCDHIIVKNRSTLSPIDTQIGRPLVSVYSHPLEEIREYNRMRRKKQQKKNRICKRRDDSIFIERVYDNDQLLLSRILKLHGISRQGTQFQRLISMFVNPNVPHSGTSYRYTELHRMDLGLPFILLSQWSSVHSQRVSFRVRCYLWYLAVADVIHGWVVRLEDWAIGQLMAWYDIRGMS